MLTSLPPAARGMVLMLVATICFTTMQTCIRIVAEDESNPLHALELVFFRNLFGLAALAPILIRSGLTPLKTRRLGLHLGRALVQSAGMICFFLGLTLIPLAEVTALSFSAPLFATVLAVLLMGERVRIRRISALLLGFAGVVIILRPGAEAIGAGALFILASSLIWAFAMIIIKSLTRTDSAVTATFYAGLFMAPLTLIPALFVWTNPTGEQLLWLVAVGVAGTVGHVAFAQAFKVAEMSAVLPLDFLRLVWASAAGFLIFAETPDIATWSGGLVIFASATYIAFREAQLGRQAGRTERSPGAETGRGGSRHRDG